ncbi:MAG: hypothetical protein C0623_11000 [Desulfuromonas sp.]|nr:MAG: hypothetical protein C0623_11000 [Desulfuromonas sp.]
MNLNDPFGRMASKYEREYEGLRESFQKMGINTPDDAQTLQEKLQRRGNWGVAIIATLTLVLSFIFPELLFLILLCGAVAVFWLIKTTAKSLEYVKRYVREELQ